MEQLPVGGPPTTGMILTYFNLRYPLNETFGTTPKGGDKLKSMPVLTVGENHPSVFDKACT